VIKSVMGRKIICSNCLEIRISEVPLYIIEYPRPKYYTGVVRGSIEIMTLVLTRQVEVICEDYFLSCDMTSPCRGNTFL
jgi:hypothetical protein